MSVQIGAPVHSFSNPTGLLSDCHRRIEMFLGSLEAVAKTIHRPLTEETAQALTLALRYFRQAAPKHTADEEESLFPYMTFTRYLQHFLEQGLARSRRSRLLDAGKIDHERGDENRRQDGGPAYAAGRSRLVFGEGTDLKLEGYTYNPNESLTTMAIEKLDGAIRLVTNGSGLRSSKCG